MDDQAGAQLVGDIAILMSIVFVVAICLMMIGIIRRCWLMWPTWIPPGTVASPTSAEFQGVTLVLMPLPAEIKARAEKQLSTADDDEPKTPSLSPADNMSIWPDPTGYYAEVKKAQIRLFVKTEVEEKIRKEMDIKRALATNSLYDGIYTRDA